MSRSAGGWMRWTRGWKPISAMGRSRTWGACEPPPHLLLTCPWALSMSGCRRRCLRAHWTTRKPRAAASPSSWGAGKISWRCCVTGHAVATGPGRQPPLHRHQHPHQHRLGRQLLRPRHRTMRRRPLCVCIPDTMVTEAVLERHQFVPLSCDPHQRWPHPPLHRCRHLHHRLHLHECRRGKRQRSRRGLHRLQRALAAHIGLAARPPLARHGTATPLPVRMVGARLGTGHRRLRQQRLERCHEVVLWMWMAVAARRGGDPAVVSMLQRAIRCTGHTATGRMRCRVHACRRRRRRCHSHSRQPQRRRATRPHTARTWDSGGDGETAYLSAF